MDERKQLARQAMKEHDTINRRLSDVERKTDWLNKA
jgi:hypothetical protein